MGETILTKNFFENTEDLSAEEKFNSIRNLKSRIEENFLQLGQILLEIKKSKLYKMKGYKGFKNFVENEYQMVNSFASKLIRVYEMFVNEMDMDEQSLLNIGFDKLNLIRPVMKKSEDNQEKEEWVNKAENLATPDLREDIKDFREKKKEQEKTIKDVVVEQYKDRITGALGCSGKNLNFKLALYFKDKDLNEISKIIKQRERQFKDEMENT